MQETRTGITLVAAVDERLAIGRHNDIPWRGRLKADMDHFKGLTEHGVVVMGRKTYASIPEKYRPLPNRENWILSRTMTGIMRCRLFRDKKEILREAENQEIFVIGGGEVYKLFLPYATRLVITHVETEVEGADAFFPDLPTNWSQMRLFRKEADAKNDFPFSVVQYDKITAV